MEYGTKYWDFRDWSWSTVDYSLGDRELEEEVFNILDNKVEEAEIKDIEVWA